MDTDPADYTEGEISLEDQPLIAEGPAYRIAVRSLKNVPEYCDIDPGPWSFETAHYLESEHADKPCPPTRFRLLCTEAGVHVRIECHWLPLDGPIDPNDLKLGETGIGEMLARDVVHIRIAPPSSSHHSSVQCVEYAISPGKNERLAYLIRKGATLERRTLEVANEYRPQSRVSLLRSLGRVYAWHVDVLLPWGIFRGLGAVPLVEGSTWHGNIVRICPATRGDQSDRVAAWRPISQDSASSTDTMGSMGYWYFQPAPKPPLRVSVTAKTLRLPRQESDTRP